MGLQYITQLNVDIDTYFLTKCDNNAFCNPVKAIKLLGFSLPIFFVGFNADRISMFDVLNDLTGNDAMISFADGIFTSKYEDVSNLIMSSNQIRGPYLGTFKVPEKCLGHNTLIFLNTSSKMHYDLRQLLKDAIPSLSQRSSLSLVHEEVPLERALGEGVPTKNVDTNDTYDVIVVRKTLIKTLFYTMFGSRLTDDEVLIIVDYLTYGATCVLGEDFHRYTFGLMLNKIGKIRKTVYNAIYVSPTGKNIIKLVENKYSYMNINETILQVSDGFLFAGLIGTEHLTTHLLNRIHGKYDSQSSVDYNALWEENRTAFMLEHARLDPPVTSVTSIVPRNVDTILRGKNVTIKAGTRNQLGLSTANKDPTVFGGRYHSKAKAQMFDPSRKNLEMIVSWNGIESFVKMGNAPRGCPAYNLSLSIAESMVDFFKEKPKATSPLVSSNNQYDFFDNIGYLIWLTSCAAWAINLLSDSLMIGSNSVYRKYYIMYLLSQVGVSISHLYGNLVLKNVFAILAAQSYVLIFIRHVNKNNTYAAIQNMLLYVMTSFHIISIIILSVRFNVSDYDTTIVMYPFYFIGSLCGLYTVYDFYKNKTDRTNYGLFGAMMGIIDMPLSNIPIIGTFLSRIFDSVFYVPNIIPLIELMDSELALRVTSSTDNSVQNLKKVSYISKRIISICITFLVVLVAWKVNDFTSLKSPDLKQSQLMDASRNFQMMYNIIDSPAESNSEYDSDPKNIKIPEWERKLDQKIIFGNISVPYEDEDVPMTWMERSTTDLYFHAIYANKYLFPISDSNIAWNNLSDAKKTISSALSTKFKKLPMFYMDSSDDVTSDLMIEKLVFAGLSVMDLELLENSTDRYRSNYMWMSDLEVRPGFHKYGASAYFNRSQKLTKIQIADRFVKPGDEGWEFSKWTWKCSMLTGITLKNHLVEIHLLYANVLTTIVREFLPRDHPIRRLIKPFNYRTVYINYHASHTLTTEYGMLHRATALSEKGLNFAFNYLFSTVRYSPFPERFNQKIIDELGDSYPFGVDGTLFYNVVSKFVGRYVNEYYPNNTVIMDQFIFSAWKNVRIFNNSRIPHISSNNDFINMVSNYIVYVTAIHNIVGDVSIYLQDPSFMASKIRPNMTVADVETSAYEILIAKSTETSSVRLMNDFSHILLHDSHYENTVNIFKDFQKDLENIERVINRRNENRKWKFDGFNPRNMKSSVSS
jgi:hypothetical protein